MIYSSSDGLMSFVRCDHPGCEQTGPNVHGANEASRRAAVLLACQYGWAEVWEGATGRQYCPEHADK